MTTQNLIITLLVVVLLASCKKDNEKQNYSFEGNYDCTIYHYHYAPDTLIKDTTYFGQLEIAVDDTTAIITEQGFIEPQHVSAEILNTSYIEWINPNGTWGLSHMRLSGDSVYARIYEHNKFGNVKYKDYSGLKLE